MYQNGQGFVPDEIVEGSQVFILGQNPGADEESEGKPFVGRTGEQMMGEFFPRAGLVRGENVSIGNTLRCRLGRTNNLPKGKELDAAIKHCTAAHLRIPESTQLVVAQGATAWLATGNDTRISDWRGFLSSVKFRGLPVLGVLHLADLFRDPKMRIPSHRDWGKIPLFLDNKWPKQLPKFSTNPYEISWESGLAFDTEYVRDTKYLIRFSIATPSGKVYVIEGKDWRAASHHLQSELSETFAAHTLPEMRRSKDAQFAARDVQGMLSQGGSGATGWADKSSEAGSASLAGVSSAAAADGRGHNLVRTEISGTESTVRDLSLRDKVGSRSLSPDQYASWAPVLTLQSGHWVAGGQHPAVRSGETVPFQIVFQNAIVDLPHLAKILPEGIVIRVDDDMLCHAVLWSEWGHDLGFLASLYSMYPKLKHLAETDPILYSAGDAVTTLEIWEGLKRELDADPESKAIYERQSLRLIPLLLRAHERGIRVNAARVGPAAGDYTFKKEQAKLLAWAHCGYPINVGSDDQLKHYLYTVEGMPVQRDKHSKKATTGTDAIAVLRGRVHPIPDFESEERDGLTHDNALGRVLEGAHPLLEARVIYAGAQQAYSHYIAPLILSDGGLSDELVGESRVRPMVRERVYPEFHIHAQANARWSTVNGDSCKGGCDNRLHKVGLPMAQLPDDLRDIVYPDEGCVWYGWDWDQLELRINAALSHDTPTIEAFDRGWDVHTLNCCDCFGYPYPPQLRKPYDAEENEEWRVRLNWRKGDKDDPRRVFAKRFVYRLDYGGDPKNAGDIPGTKALGLDSRALVQASNRYLAAHPNKAKWRQEAAIYLATTKEIPVARTFMGRKRKLLSGGKARLREYFDYPMQGSVSDIKNVVLLDIYDALPELEFMYEMHDSAWEQGQAADCQATGDVWKVLKPLIEREWTVNGVRVTFPATLKQQCVLHKSCFKKEMR